MSTEGLRETHLKSEISIKTHKKTSGTNKPYELHEKQNKKVDINILKARIQAVHEKESKRNVYIFISFILTVTVLIFYLSA